MSSHLRASLGGAALAFLSVACGGGTSTETPKDTHDGGASTSSQATSSRHVSSTSIATSEPSSSTAPTSIATTGTSGTVSTGVTTSAASAPTNHRPNDDACLQPAPPGTCQFGSGVPTCHADSQCTEGGVDGRCMEFGGGPAGCFCTYDICKDDSACPKGYTCACHGAPYSDSGNTCIPSDCRVDSDCGAGGYCSPSPNSTGCGGLAGYYCHTPKDKCVNDSDCAQLNEGCAYVTAASRWECQRLPACA